MGEGEGVSKMKSITHSFDTERFFQNFPIPKEYDNKDTRIQMSHGVEFDDFKIILTNKKLPPLVLGADKQWHILTPVQNTKEVKCQAKKRGIGNR